MSPLGRVCFAAILVVAAGEAAAEQSEPGTRPIDDAPSPSPGSEDGDPQSGSAAPDPEGSRVTLSLAGATEEAALLEALLRQLLPASASTETSLVPTVDLMEVLARTEGGEAALARVWIDMTDPDRIALVVIDGAWQRALLREVRAPAGVDAVAREELGQIVAAAVETLLAGGGSWMSTAEASAQLEAASGRGAAAARGEQLDDDELPWGQPVPDEAGRAGPPLRLRLSLGYEVELWDAEVSPLHGPAVWLELAFPNAPLDLGLLLGGAYALPVTATGAGVDIGLEHGRLLAAVTIRPLALERLALVARVGARVDIARVEPRLAATSETPGLVPEAAHLLVTTLIHAAVELEVRLFRALSLTAGVGVDVDPAATRFVVQASEASEVVFQPWIARPTFWLGLSVWLV